MFISKISVENFRCFEEMQFEFKEKFTALVGDNGVGKSAALRVLRTAIAGLLTRMQSRFSDALIEASDKRVVALNSMGVWWNPSPTW